MSCEETLFFIYFIFFAVEEGDYKRLTAVPRHEADSIPAPKKQSSSSG